ncbi:unnamed protein product [Cuscuta campestris]|uniref:Uncharacterized protein n=1 Tax=Cuscuta campestris TaxID=132261 RepID=A0A484M4P8_9ASTE|nr:unnamed protein product [Cuscuta campestris]
MVDKIYVAGVYPVEDTSKSDVERGGKDFNLVQGVAVLVEINSKNCVKLQGWEFKPKGFGMFCLETDASSRTHD